MDWLEKLRGKRFKTKDDEENMVCLGLKLKMLKIERINDLDIGLFGAGWLHSLGSLPLPVTGEDAERFVRKSVNHLLYNLLFENLTKLLYETKLPYTTLETVFTAIACKYSEENFK